MTTPTIEVDHPSPDLLARIGELSAVSCALLLVHHGFEVVADRDVNVLRDRVASGYRLGKIDPDKIIMEWLYDEGWLPIESVYDDDDLDFERPAS
jgi:hypothetical protein